MRKGLIFILSGIVLLFVVLFIVEKETYNIKEVKSDEIKEIIKDNDYVFLHIGKPTKELKKRVKGFKKNYRINTYYTEMTKTDIEKELSLVLDNNPILVFVNGKYVSSMIVSVNDKYYKDFIDKYIYGKVLDSERLYKIAKNANEYIKMVNSKNYTVAVIGYEGCNYCKMYLPIINKVAKEKIVDIYYFDRDNYDEDEFQKVINLNFEIPAKCNTKGEVKTMSEGFAKPMTLITKNGKLVDCIKGYVSEDELLNTLTKYKIVKKGSSK